MCVIAICDEIKLKQKLGVFCDYLIKDNQLFISNTEYTMLALNGCFFFIRHMFLGRNSESKSRIKRLNLYLSY